MANVSLTSKAKIVILFANQYDMKDEDGNKLAGCSVHYMFWGAVRSAQENRRSLMQ